MTITDHSTEAAELLSAPEPWADMDRWHERMREIRRDTPVVAVQADGFAPFLAVLRYADVYAVERDSDLWHNTERSVLQPEEEIRRMVDAGLPMPRTLVHLDGVDHRDHRQVANDWFKPASVRHRQPRIDAIADLFINRMRDLGGRCDFAKDIAQPFTLRVIMDIFGVPESDEAMMLELTQGLFGAGDPEFLGDAADPGAAVINSIMKFIEYFNAITADRQQCPTEDLATVIANGQPGGCPMGEAERLWYYIIVATAGHDTTSFGLSGGMEALLRDPDQLWAIRADPSLAANAAEEAIRWTSPVRHFMRYATRPTEVAGVPVGEGERIMLSYPSANRDEAVFDDPDRFDIRRSNADRLISFGGGSHFCLGAQFARREIRTMLARLSAELESIEPDGPAEWAASNFVSGVKHLPVRYRFAR
ncbi:cytochrome P450 [Acidiferrimicrobium sp. IK]|uniref:cytochrome P450 n=1 Tax=Acidiferrimicrobium sp. IK TaxID=2871700 RepID=UPI0021CB7AB8|nr:cytochrome P450 [Acidiferrimicrobium sp. IK]MCU4186811.1 cytochrome P450 [Acidiferrimicrobium sp. IK]